jgi:hypothetical protein
MPASYGLESSPSNRGNLSRPFRSRSAAGDLPFWGGNLWHLGFCRTGDIFGLQIGMGFPYTGMSRREDGGGRTQCPLGASAM